jgi:hypothetical protein
MGDPTTGAVRAGCYQVAAAEREECAGRPVVGTIEDVGDVGHGHQVFLALVRQGDPGELVVRAEVQDHRSQTIDGRSDLPKFDHGEVLGRRDADHERPADCASILRSAASHDPCPQVIRYLSNAGMSADAVTTTIDDRSKAQGLARVAVRARFAACAQVGGPRLQRVLAWTACDLPHYGSAVRVSASRFLRVSQRCAGRQWPCVAFDQVILRLRPVISRKRVARVAPRVV